MQNLHLWEKFFEQFYSDFFQKIPFIYWMTLIYICIYIYIYHHHHVVPLTWISLTLSRHSSLLSITPSRSSKATFCVHAELLYVNSSSSVWRDPSENITYEFVLTSPEVSHRSCSSNMDGFRDGQWMAVQLLFCGVLPPGFVQ